MHRKLISFNAQAVSLTKSDSWMCPECEDKKSNSKKRGRPKKQEEKQRLSTDSDNKPTKDKKQSTVKEKCSKVNPSPKIVSKTTREKKQSISKKYISDKDTSDTEEDVSRESSLELRNERGNGKSNKKITQNKIAAKPVSKPPVETVEKKSLTKHDSGADNSKKCQSVRKGSEMKKRPFAMSDSLSDSDEDASSVEESPSIIRIPMDASQLDHSYSSSEDD